VPSSGPDGARLATRSAARLAAARRLPVIRNGFVSIGVNSYWEEAFVGVIIIIAVPVDQIRTRGVFRVTRAE
jgi:ribose transport system permease protein